MRKSIVRDGDGVNNARGTSETAACWLATIVGSRDARRAISTARGTGEGGMRPRARGIDHRRGTCAAPFPWRPRELCVCRNRGGDSVPSAEWFLPGARELTGTSVGRIGPGEPMSARNRWGRGRLDSLGGAKIIWIYTFGRSRGICIIRPPLQVRGRGIM